jgi:hypothetical protein
MAECVKYVDDRPIFIPCLTNYPGGITLPGKNNILKVTKGEKKNLMRIKNGINICFEDVISKREA